jgi:hypothetical protein
LNGDIPQPCHGAKNGFEDRSELWTIRILPLDQFLGGRLHEIRIAELLHDQKILGIAGHPLLHQPSAECFLILQMLCLDTLVPGSDIHASALLEEPS